MKLAALAVCAAMLSTSAYADFEGRTFQPCDNRPPVAAQHPINVPVSILTVPGTEMFVRCRKQIADVVIYGCTFLPSAEHQATILINADQDPRERACTLLYEESHLPPNNWLDRSMEAVTLDTKSAVAAP